MADGDKTEDPTPKRLREAWEQGNFAKAPEIGAAFALAVAFAVFAFQAPAKAEQLQLFTRTLFYRLSEFEITIEAAGYWGQRLMQEGIGFIAPLLGAAAGAAVIAGGLQTGFRLSPKALEMKLDKLSPAKGAKNLFSPKKFVQLGVDLAKFAVIGTVIYALVRQIMKDPVFHMPVPITHLAHFMYETMLQMLVYLVIAMTAIAAVHFLYQKQSKFNELKMTRQEVMDEFKNQEGNPEVKRARRQMAQRLLQGKMLAAVPQADVVVTNPTHYAVALRYERGKDAAPVVLAKGENRFAQRIKKAAAEAGVPMVENRPVARTLYKLGKVDSPIPRELFQAVAEILGYVYRTHRQYFYQKRLRQQQADREVNRG
ncbi:MAG: EscU/YscU/HrcU family type III secretion system export apparatus switch protein [Verrucomicrobiota bacterium JB022]|nr:EscU/YscU/HrcU family type III secretion system export apparatus switch protein [Verrucomicrobiota bacterium JB022]